MLEPNTQFDGVKRWDLREGIKSEEFHPHGWNYAFIKEVEGSFFVPSHVGMQQQGAL